jgi:hypothetical protein
MAHVPMCPILLEILTVVNALRLKENAFGIQYSFPGRCVRERLYEGRLQ